MVTGLAEGEVVCALISRLVALVCRAIGPSLSMLLVWCHALTGQIKLYGGKSVRFGSTNSLKVPWRCQRLVSFEPPLRSQFCVYQASAAEKYCLAHVCFGSAISTVFTWEAQTLHLKNNVVREASCSSEKEIPRCKAECTADLFPFYNSIVSNTHLLNVL